MRLNDQHFIHLQLPHNHTKDGKTGSWLMIMGCDNMLDFFEMAYSSVSLWWLLFLGSILPSRTNVPPVCIESIQLSPVNIKVVLIEMDKTHPDLHPYRVLGYSTQCLL